MRPVQGFSLLEMLVVLVLMSVVLAVAAPGLIRLLGSTSVRSAALTLCAGVRQARLTAVVHHQPIVMSWRAGALMLVGTDGRTVHRLGFPAGISCHDRDSEALPSDVQFRPDGTADPAHWRVAQAHDQGLVVGIDGPTASARLETPP